MSLFEDFKSLSNRIHLRHTQNTISARNEKIKRKRNIRKGNDGRPPDTFRSLRTQSRKRRKTVTNQTTNQTKFKSRKTNNKIITNADGERDTAENNSSSEKYVVEKISKKNC